MRRAALRSGVEKNIRTTMPRMPEVARVSTIPRSARAICF